MAYEKQTWVTGEVITKEKLNHMEDGIANSGGGGIMIVSADPQAMKLNKTFNELKNAFKANIPVILMIYNETRQAGTCELFEEIWVTDGVYSISTHDRGLLFTTTDPDDYPSMNENEG